MNDYPSMIAAVNHVEPVPRRVRAYLGQQLILDTIQALYVWEWPNYPQYYIPQADVHREYLVDQMTTQQTRRGKARVFGLSAGQEQRHDAARLLDESPVDGLFGMLRFEWAALDAWFEEDEQVFVHPRNPYVRVDAVRSTCLVRVELDGVLLAESRSPVLVFETGLPTRYYLNRTEVRFENLIASDTVTQCPYKGTTTGYWSVRVGGTVYPDLAWSYSFPTKDLIPIAGLIAFYNEKVDISLDGSRMARPNTHFFA